MSKNKKKKQPRARICSCGRITLRDQCERCRGRLFTSMDIARIFKIPPHLLRA